MERIRVMLADDHAVVLESLAMMISSLAGIQVVATAADGQAALDQLDHQAVDIVLSDMHMPGLNGVELALRILERYPAVKLILLTMEEKPESIRMAMQAGVWGYVLKRASKKELEEAIHTVASGSKYFAREVSQQLALLPDPSTSYSRETSETIQSLSKREIEIIRLIVNDVPNQEIADQLFISPKTVETHRRNIFKKLNIHSVVALTRFAVNYKLI
ncbi:response regulator [Salmonirosea aquatica]|uniref:Response regulator n=1 Tax=Salmonirosea aquatica TaxID=2654236 RepID=A0A7C9BEE7_9BACT|nr:response regulator [Cytophagaceae bacterium SJW1-29]